MLTPEEMQAFIAEVRSDIKWLNVILTDKCKKYDRHVEDGAGVRERLKDVERIAGRAAQDIDNILWRVIFGGILASVFTTVIVSTIIKGLN